jgi:hypothetical protein
MADKSKRREHDEIVVESFERTVGNLQWLSSLDDDLWERLRAVVMVAGTERLRRDAEKLLNTYGMLGMVREDLARKGKKRDD